MSVRDKRVTFSKYFDIYFDYDLLTNKHHSDAQSESKIVIKVGNNERSE